jgi:hypothetical protein
VVEVGGRTPDGRTDQASKYVPLTGFDERTGQTYRLTGRKLSDAFSKAETGAKRRLTFSMIGLGAVQDLETVEKVRYVVVSADGTVLDQPTPAQRYLAENPRAARVVGEPTFETTVDPSDAPLAGTSQAPTGADLEPPKREVKRQSFRPNEEEIARRNGAFWSMARGTSLDDDDTRHTYNRQWTASHNWPRAKQTESVRTLLARATPDEAAMYLNDIRKMTDQEKQFVVRVEEQRIADAEADAEPEPDPDEPQLDEHAPF